MVASQKYLREEEFTLFARWLMANKALLSVDWAPLVIAAGRSDFEKLTGVTIKKQLDFDGEMVESVIPDGVESHFPVLYTMPQESAWLMRGADYGYDPI